MTQMEDDEIAYMICQIEERTGLFSFRTLHTSLYCDLMKSHYTYTIDWVYDMLCEAGVVKDFYDYKVNDEVSGWWLE